MIRRGQELKSYIYEEMVAHLPFTLIGVSAGVGFVILAMFASGWGSGFGEEQFHWAHILHIFFSAAAGAAIFRSYRDSVLKAVPVAALSAVLLCTVSDILIPYAGLKLSGYTAHLHICLQEHPVRVAVSALLGVSAGLIGVRFFAHCNRGFHLMHLLISTAASTLYLLSMIPQLDLRFAIVTALTLFFALVLPCLAGDILVPLLLVRMKEPYSHEHVHHSGHSADHTHKH
ncbi:MAG: hypothetical protein KBD07_04565 [Candidatus Omnitrophica bacterium]|nr:hypothetical protein [Candidatus Omnitrophota bacterium]